MRDKEGERGCLSLRSDARLPKRDRQKTKQRENQGKEDRQIDRKTRKKTNTAERGNKEGLEETNMKPIQNLNFYNSRRRRKEKKAIDQNISQNIALNVWLLFQSYCYITYHLTL